MAVKGLDYLKSAERWQRYGENYHDEARVYYAELNKTALTIGTFLLGFIGIFIQIGDVKTEPLFNKLLLGSGFIFSTISIILGFFLFIMMNKFLNRSGDYYEQLSENLHLWMVKNKINYGQEYPKEIWRGFKLTIQTGDKLSYAQLSFLGLAFAGVAGYFFLHLFC
ncbi:hypothetical protein GW864_04480 [bacterium]|nr:hypothetical protein [bacterium]